MLPTSTKHHLLIEYNNKRKEKFENFMIDKCGGEDTFRKTMDNPLKKTLEFDENNH